MIGRMRMVTTDPHWLARLDIEVRNAGDADVTIDRLNLSHGGIRFTQDLSKIATRATLGFEAAQDTLLRFAAPHGTRAVYDALRRSRVPLIRSNGISRCPLNRQI